MRAIMMPPRSPAPAVLTALGIVVLLLGVWPNWWFGGEQKIESSYLDEDMAISFDFGLREISACNNGQCGSMNYSSMPSEMMDKGDDEAKRFKRFVWAGGATFWAGMVCVGCMVGSLLLWTMRQRLPFSLPTVGGALAVVTVIGGTIAFALKPSLPDQTELMKIDFSMGLGYPLCLIGGVMCAIGAFLMHKEERAFAAFGSAAAYGVTPYYGGPAAPGPMPGQVGYGQSAYAPPPQVLPACPRCSAPTVFVAEHQRYFCASCRAYL